MLLSTKKRKKRVFFWEPDLVPQEWSLILVLKFGFFYIKRIKNLIMVWPQISSVFLVSAKVALGVFNASRRMCLV
jgi:hypothetical protein